MVADKRLVEGSRTKVDYDGMYVAFRFGPKHIMMCMTQKEKTLNDFGQSRSHEDIVIDFSDYYMTVSGVRVVAMVLTMCYSTIDLPYLMTSRHGAQLNTSHPHDISPTFTVSINLYEYLMPPSV
ncbi:hypothetical protein KIN20_004736 [Parelaphostrongylus tenuis]|uniref:Uncharacterized protein n=1 Tax=Parelaphostrongylus tenuis TaxID=148309 RepID=A0AAD5QJJ9_PARTN|nr:hypothetical protein KIN20_004736 [Parelaphostrongylus tenuis]